MLVLNNRVIRPGKAIKANAIKLAESPDSRASSRPLPPLGLDNTSKTPASKSWLTQVNGPSAVENSGTTELARWNDVRDELLNRSFLNSPATDEPGELKYKWTAKGLESLVPLDDSDFRTKVGGPLANKELRQKLADSLQFKTTAGQKVSTELLALKHEGAKDEALLFGVVRNDETQRVEGIFDFGFSPVAEGKPELKAHLGGIYVNLEDRVVKGYADTLLDFFADEVYPTLEQPVLKEELKADYFGRKVWTQRGFEFSDNSDKKIAGLGDSLSFLEYSRSNLENLCDSHQIPKNGLTYQHDGEVTPLENFSQLETAKEFLSVAHPEHKITARPMNGFASTKEATEYNLGEAFMLGSHYANAQDVASGNFVARSPSSYPLNRNAMSYFNAERAVPQK